MLKPLSGSLQPFRFVQIDPGYRKRLENTLKKLEAQGQAPVCNQEVAKCLR